MTEAELIEKYPDQIKNILSKHSIFLDGRQWYSLSKEQQSGVVNNTFDWFCRKIPRLITYEGDVLYMGDTYYSLGKNLHGGTLYLQKYTCYDSGGLQDYTKGWIIDGCVEYMCYSKKENAERQHQIFESENEEKRQRLKELEIKRIADKEYADYMVLKQKFEK